VDRPNLAGMKARCEAATPGPWEHEWDEGKPTNDVIRWERPKPGDVSDEMEAALIATADDGPHDTAFIAHARTDLPAVIEYAERLEAALEEERSKLANERFRRFVVRKSDRSDHTTACSIWGDNGQGGTAEGFKEPLPCNCGALENFQKERSDRAEAALRGMVESHDTLLAIFKGNPVAMGMVYGCFSATGTIAKSRAALAGETQPAPDWMQYCGNENCRRRLDPGGKCPRCEPVVPDKEG
jgi:hypothetical protein